jgi:hypothetical protein
MEVFMKHVSDTGQPAAAGRGILLRGFVKKEGDRWVSICIDLDIAAEGDTPSMAANACIELCFEYVKYVCETYPDKIGEYIPRLVKREDVLKEFNTASFLDPLRSLKTKRPRTRSRLQPFSTTIDPSQLAACA